MDILNELKKELKSMGSPERAKASVWYFKTGKGEYGEGDRFLGLNMSQQRKIAKKFAPLISSKDAIRFLEKNRYHEERMTALLILMMKYKKGTPAERERIYDSYLANTKFINNWDLVDVTCRDIVGEHLFGKDKKILYKLAKSKNLWERRIAIISTFYFISKGRVSDTYDIAKILLSDEYDIIHKAVGWALREAGKKDAERLKKFLRENIRKISRTTLRYAIERFTEQERKKFMKL